MWLRALWLACVVAVAGGGFAKEFSGEVVDPAGNPIPGAQLVVASGERDTAPLVETVTDAAGRFTGKLADDDAGRAGYLVCLVFAPGWSIGGKPLNALAQEPRITLEPAVSLVVPVQDPDGKPLAGLTLRLGFISREPGPGATRLLFPLPVSGVPGLLAVSDDQGSARFEQLPPGSAVRVEVDDDRFARSEFWFTAGAADAPIRLQRAGTLRGRVIYETGEPAAGASVHYIDRGKQVRESASADAGGRFEMARMPPGVGLLIAVPPEGQRDAWATAAEPVVELPAFNPEAEVDLVLRRGVPLTITVVDDATGQPAEGLMVMVNGPQCPAGGWTGAAGTYRLDAQGRAMVRVLPGEQTIHYGILDSTGRYENQPYPPPTVTVAEGQPQTFELRAKPRQVLPAYVGRVVDAAGRPVAGATLQAEQQSNSFPDIGDDGQTDAEGRFEVANQGSQTALVTAYKGTAGTVGQTTMQPGVEATLTLQDNAQARVTVMVSAPDGQPLQGAQVDLFRWSENYGMQRGSATTDVAGTASLPCWPHDKYTVHVQCAGYGQVNSDPFPIKPGEQTTQGPFVLPKADAFVAGWVIGADGQPAAGITVQINGEPHGYQRTTTNAQGEFRFEGIVDAAVPLHAYSPDGKLQGMMTAKANDENAVITIKQRD